MAEDRGEQYELDTGVKVTVITDEEVDQPEVSGTSPCRTVLLVMGVVLALPVVTVFPEVLTYYLDSLTPAARDRRSADVGETPPLHSDLYGSRPEWSRSSDEAPTPGYLAWLCPRHPDDALCTPTTTTTTTTTPTTHTPWSANERERGYLNSFQATLTWFDKDHGSRSQQEIESETGSELGSDIGTKATPSEEEKEGPVQFQMAEWTLKGLSSLEIGGSRRRRKRSAGSDGENFQVVEDTYTTLYKLFGIVSGVSIVVLNYRVTAAVGGGVAGLACLVAPFLPPDRHALAFVLGALPAIGNNLVATSVWVALLEHFRQRRLLVLSLTSAASILASLGYLLVKIFLFPELGDPKWSLLYQAATYVFCLLGALALVPLNLRMRGEPRETVRGRMLGISGLRLFKSPLLYVLAFVNFFHSLGSGIPKTHVAAASGGGVGSLLLVLLIGGGSSLGLLLNCCVGGRPISLSLKAVLLIVGELGLLMGFLTLGVAALGTLVYAILYCLLFGFFKGIRTPLLLSAIPLTVGEEHLGLAVGVISFASGLGSIIGDESAAAIARDLSRVDGAFYLAGVSLLVSSAFCFLLIKLKFRTTAETSGASLEPGHGTSPETGHGTSREAGQEERGNRTNNRSYS